MKAMIFSIITLVLFIFSGCEKQNETIRREPIKLTTEQKQIVSSSNTFGFGLFRQEVDAGKEGENIFVSPLSVSLALSMLYNGAGTSTREELTEGLGFSGLSEDQVNVANRDLIKAREVV
jgi:serpin B